MKFFPRARTFFGFKKRIVSLQLRNSIFLKHGDTLKGIALIREIKASNLAEKTKEKLIRQAKVQVQKHIDEARRLQREEEDATENMNRD